MFKIKFTLRSFQELLQKMSKEDKTIVLLGDFNIDLLKYDTNKDSTAFLDLMYTNFLWILDKSKPNSFRV